MGFSVSLARKIFLLLPLHIVSANWLLQCSTCVDQTFYSDAKLKADAQVVNNQDLLNAIKQVRVHQFTHREEEHYNKFFNRTQLGILAQDLQEIMPQAVATVPERRYTDMLGASKVNKDVLLIRDSHLLFSAVGALNHLAHEVDGAEEVIVEHGKSLAVVQEEQGINKRKREEFMEQLLRIVATQEVLSTALREADKRFSEVEVGFSVLKEDTMALTNLQSKRQDHVESALHNVTAILEKEAHADLVQKTKRSELELEKVKTLREIENLRYSEEQKTIRLRNKEKKDTEEAIMELNKKRIKFEQEQKLETDLSNIKATEASNLRQLAAKAKHEREIKGLEVEALKYKAELELKQAVEAAKIEQEAKIKEIRENEDIHAREQRMKLEGQKQQVIVAIQATARIVMSWITSLYGSTMNMMYGLASFLSIVIGIYFTKEMAVLLREQLNKRLGRPSLVRLTSKKTRLGEMWRLLTYFCRKRKGSEFDDVVLHKKLEDQIFRLAKATSNAKARGMPLLHIMFYGPPGTGKTMCAQRFAEYSGLEYAFMSGADVAPLEEQAVTELHKLFSWVHKSRKGVLLFIDEADAFLSVRNKNMSESLRNALTTMLYHTGTQTSQFLMVLATNRPGDLDPAVLDRIDDSVEFGLPELPEREKLVRQYFNLYVSKPLQIKLADPKDPISQAATTSSSDDADCDADTLDQVAAQLRTFSGREISKLFTGLQTHICADIQGSGVRGRNLRLSKKTILEVVRSKVEEHFAKLDVLAKGYEYVHKEGPNLSGTGLTMTGTPDRRTGFGGLGLSGSLKPVSKADVAHSGFLANQASSLSNQAHTVNINIQNGNSNLGREDNVCSPKSRQELYSDVYGRVPIGDGGKGGGGGALGGDPYSPVGLVGLENLIKGGEKSPLDGFVGMNTPNHTPSKDGKLVVGSEAQLLKDVEKRLKEGGEGPRNEKPAANGGAKAKSTGAKSKKKL